MLVTITIPARGNAAEASIPYRRLTKLTYAIQRDANDAPDPVTFVVEGMSTDHGSARIIGPKESQGDSGTITVLGENQTEKGSSANLYVRAKMSGTEVAPGSPPFSVCAHPAAVTNGPECIAHYSEEEGLRVGMYISIGVVSDSGVTADLDEVEDQERVSNAQDQSELLRNVAVQPEIGNTEPAHTARFDRHRSEVAYLRELNDSFLRGQPGEWSNYQLDIFRCDRCGMKHFVAIPNSGYRITRRITSCPPNRLRFSVTKTACESTVDAWTSGPGPSDPQSVAIDVEMRAADIEAMDAPDEIRLGEF